MGSEAGPWRSGLGRAYYNFGIQAGKPVVAFIDTLGSGDEAKINAMNSQIQISGLKLGTGYWVADAIAGTAKMLGVGTSAVYTIATEDNSQMCSDAAGVAGKNLPFAVANIVGAAGGYAALRTGTIAGASGDLVPLNGRINVGGGLEIGSDSATNLNPIVAGTGGPTSGIPNHVLGRFEEMGSLFEPGSANLILSNRLPFGTVSWADAAQGAYSTLESGGELSLNVWTNSASQTEAIVSAFESAGFQGVRTIGSGPGTIIIGVKP